MEKYFKLKEHNTDVRTEIIAGVTTFLSMVYILAVNPSILSASGMDPASIFTATAISAAFGTLLMAFLANYPVALASGMGLNAYFAFTVCPMVGTDKPWQVALAAVCVEGIIFILLSFTNFRESLVNDIPQNLKSSISVGIGLFIAIIGLKNSGAVSVTTENGIALGSLANAAVTPMSSNTLSRTAISFFIINRLAYPLFEYLFRSFPSFITDGASSFSFTEKYRLRKGKFKNS